MTIEVGASGGGVFVPSFLSGLIVEPTSQSGDFIILTPPSGQRVHLTGLASDSGGTAGAISIEIGSTTVLSGIILDNAQTQSGGNYIIDSINGTGLNRGLANSGGTIKGGVDEAITISSASSTSSQIMYMYETGVLK